MENLISLLTFGIPGLLQLAVLIHAIKSGKTQPWLYIILFLPGIGAIAYIIVEILPGFTTNWNISTIAKLFDTPEKRISKLEAEQDTNNTVAHKAALADAYTEVGQYEKAIALYKDCLKGLYADDEAINKSLTVAYILDTKFMEAHEQIERLRKIRKGTLKPDEILLLAQIQEGLGDTKVAEELYAKAALSYPGMEANYRYCAFLQKHNKHAVLEQEKIVSKRKFDGMFPKLRRYEKTWMQQIQSL